MLNRALFSSVKDDWPTPWEFFHHLDLEFDFTLMYAPCRGRQRSGSTACRPMRCGCGGKRRSADCSLTLLWTASRIRGPGGVAT